MHQMRLIFDRITPASFLQAMRFWVGLVSSERHSSSPVLPLSPDRCVYTDTFRL